MGKKRKLPDPFTPEACQRLRKLASIRTQAIKKKHQAQKTRDEIDGEIVECGPDETAKLQKLKAEWADEVREIKRMNDVVNSTEDKIIETIEKGDQLELIQTLNPNPTVASLFKEDAAAAEEEDDDEVYAEAAAD